MVDDPRTPTVVPERLPRVDEVIGSHVLDSTAGAAVQCAVDAMRVWDAFRPLVASYMGSLRDIVEKQVEFAKGYNPAAHDDYVREVHATTGALLGQLDRLARTTMSLAKAADTVARLRKFLEGGEQRDDLNTKSIAELARIVRGAARALGDD